MIILFHFFINENPLLDTNIHEEPMDDIDNSNSQDEGQDTFMEEATFQINEASVNEFIQDFYTSFE